jgi:hypothetical protein
MADRAVWADSIVFDAPRFDLAPRVVEAQEPKCVQALLPDTAVEALGKGIVSRLARPRVVEHDAMLSGPEVQITRDELRAIIDPDTLWSAMLAGCSFQSSDDIMTVVGVPDADRGTQLGADIDDRQDAQLAAVKQLIDHEVHRPALVGRGRRHPILP